MDEGFLDSTPIMQVENGIKWLYIEGEVHLERSIFYFHDYGRKGKSLKLLISHNRNDTEKPKGFFVCFF